MFKSVARLCCLIGSQKGISRLHRFSPLAPSAAFISPFKYLKFEMFRVAPNCLRVALFKWASKRPQAGCTLLVLLLGHLQITCSGYAAMADVETSWPSR